LIYDRDSSLLTVVDDLHKTILPLTQDSQTALKLLGTIASARLQNAGALQANGARILQLVRQNAKAFFNGVPALKGQGVQKEGFTCDDYLTDVEGKKTREVWMTTPEQAGMNAEDYNTLRSLAHLALGLCEDELTDWGADTTDFKQGFNVPQMPVREVLYLKGRPSCLFQIRGIQPQDFGPETFAAPAGYKISSLLDILKQGFQ
jgi:hypothetical protein